MGVRRASLATIVIALAVAFGLVLHIRSDTRSIRARVVFVQRDPLAADAARVRGASAREQVAARAGLALIGADARGMRLRFTQCSATDAACRRTHATRLLRIEPPTSTPSDDRQREWFLAGVAARDASARLLRDGERVVWRAAPLGGEYGPTMPSPHITRGRLVDAAHAISARAARAGWTLAPIRLYTTSGGAMIVTVHFDDRMLLTNHNTAFLSTLYGPRFQPPISRTLFRITGPNGELEGGGARTVGATYGPTVLPHLHGGRRIPGWLFAKTTRLSVTISRITPPRTVHRVVRCAAASQAPSIRTTCGRLFRSLGTLLSPVQSDNACLGGAWDSSTISGSIAGIPIRRDFTNCYSGATYAWERLLNVAP